MQSFKDERDFGKEYKQEIKDQLLASKNADIEKWRDIKNKEPEQIQ